MKDEVPKLTNGSRKIDWIYIEDVADGLIASALANDALGETVEIGSGDLITIRSVVEELVNLVNPTITPNFGAITGRLRECVRQIHSERCVDRLEK